MNAHYCTYCKRGYWINANLGDMEPTPKHTSSGKIVKGKGAVILCPGARKKAVVVKPPGAS